jgi:hypothetical protein
MNDLSAHSNPSFEGPESHRTPSIAITVTTDTSTNTVSGLGTLSGRVAFGLGKAVIRGADNLVRQRISGHYTTIFWSCQGVISIVHKSESKRYVYCSFKLKTAKLAISYNT